MSEEQIRDTLAQMVRVGFVSARQPEKMRVRVELRDTVTAALVTDWLPVLCPRACGDLAYDLPDVGDQVLCLFLGYGLEQGFVLGAMYGKADPPVSSGDIWQRSFSDGTVLAYDRAAHKLTAQVRGEAALRADGPLTLEAPVIYLRGTLVNTARDGAPGSAVLSGSLTVTGGGVNVPDADVMAGAVSLTSHLTSGVQPGSGQSGPPVGGGSGAGGGGDANAEIRFERLWSNDPADATDTERLLLCLPSIAQAEADRKLWEDDAVGWEYLRKMFLRWFSSPGSTRVSENPPFWVSMDWILRYERARIAFNAHVGMENLTSPKALERLTLYLKERGYLVGTEKHFDCTVLPWPEWDAAAFQFTVVRGMASATADGLMAAMGDFAFRALAGGKVQPLVSGGHRIFVTKLAVIVWDSFNFDGDYNLGYWSCEQEGFTLNPGSEKSGYKKLENRNFNEFRKKRGFGQDFLVLSEPRLIDNFRSIIYDTVL